MIVINSYVEHSMSSAPKQHRCRSYHKYFCSSHWCEYYSQQEHFDAAEQQRVVKTYNRDIQGKISYLQMKVHFEVDVINPSLSYKIALKSDCDIIDLSRYSLSVSRNTIDLVRDSVTTTTPPQICCSNFCQHVRSSLYILCISNLSHARLQNYFVNVNFFFCKMKMKNDRSNRFYMFKIFISVRTWEGEYIGKAN